MCSTNREVYPVRSGCIDSGKKYEFKAAAYFSLCMLGNSDELKLSTNQMGCGDMDDIAIYIVRNGIKHRFFFQLKHKDSKAKVSRHDFLSRRGHFFLEKHSKVVDPNDTNNDAVLRELGDTQSNIYFVLYTNMGVNEENYVVACDTENSLLWEFNSGSQGKLYKLEMDKLLQNSGLQIDTIFSERLFVFSNQGNVKQIDLCFVDQIKRIFSSDLSDACAEEVAREYTNFITEWACGNLGGHYFLSNTVIISKLTEILLHPHASQFYHHKLDTTPAINFEIWDLLLQHKSMVLVEESGDEMLPTFFYTHAKQKINAITSNAVDWEQSSAVLWQNAAVKNELLLTVGKKRVLTFLDVAVVLWKLGEIALVVKYDHKLSYNRLMNLSNNKLKLVVMFENSRSKVPLGLEKITKNNPQVFYTLGSINQSLLQRILDQGVHIQGRPVVLRHLIGTDRVAIDLIEARDVIKILCGNFNIGNTIVGLPKFYINRTIPRILLKLKVLKSCPKDRFVITCKSHYTLLYYLQNHLSAPNLDITDYEAVIHNDAITNQIITTRNCVPFREVAQKIHNEGENTHHLLWHGMRNFEWVETLGGVKNIRNFKYCNYSSNMNNLKKGEELERIENEWSISLDDQISTYSKQINIVSAGPGMGKSIVINYLACKAPSYHWVLRIVLGDYYDYYNSKDFEQEMDAAQYLTFFNDRAMQNVLCNQTLSKRVFDTFLKDGKVLILLDGFDEIASSHDEEVLNMITTLNKAGHKIWLTTRPVMEPKLEKYFGTLAITLNPFTVDDQRKFLFKFYHEAICTPDSQEHDGAIKEFAKKLLRITNDNFSDWENEFTGVPLQTRLLAEVFLGACQKYVDEHIFSVENSLNLLDLYERFTEAKINTVVEKFGHLYVGKTKKSVEVFHKQYALLTLFSQSELKDANLHKYKESDLQEIQNLQEYGVITVENNFNISFVHRTFAEFFVAKWIMENLGKTEAKSAAQKILRIVLQHPLTKPVILNIFNRLATKGYELHTAVLDGNYTKVQQLVSNNIEIVSKTDFFGRTALHLSVCLSLSNTSITKLLIAHTRTPLQRDQVFNFNAADYAIENMSLLTAEGLLRQVGLQQLHTDIMDDDILIHKCARNGYICIVKSMLMSVPKERVKQLLEYNHHNFGTALHEAVRNKQPRSVYILIEEGSDVNLVDDEGNTALHLAVDGDNVQNVSLLLNAGADVNIKDKAGNTAREIAEKAGKEDMVKLFLTIKDTNQGSWCHLS